MLNSSSRQVFIFDKRGTQYARLDLPELFYLETEKDFINKMLKFSRLEGMALLIDWDKKEVSSIRFSDE